MKNKKLLTIDLDNTLVITTKAHALAFKKAFAKRGIFLETKKIEKFIDGRSGEAVVKALFPFLDRRTIKEIVKDHNKFLKRTAIFIKTIKKASKTLKFLRKNYRLVLVSNCSKEEIKLLLKKAKIPLKIFDFIISSENLRPKPWPDQLLKAKQLSNSKHIIHIGDSVYDVKAAKKVKAISIAVLTGKAKRKELKKYGADFIIKDITFLPKILKNL
ncbi:MAG: HAD family hydrolase [Candidatus Pacearchaeota archaeon]|nr:HAD family hydrolase [Candidatus Pacearchaeota archaeon]